MAAAKAALQHLLDRARQPQFGRVSHLLGGQRGRGGADRFAGARQQVAAQIDDGDARKFGRARSSQGKAALTEAWLAVRSQCAEESKAIRVRRVTRGHQLRSL